MRTSAPFERARAAIDSAIELIPRILGRVRLPILALSAHPDDRVVVALLDAGADDVINAAFRPPELLARLRALLRRAGGPSQAPPAGPLPDGLVAFIVFHELVHLKVRNHGPDFKALIAKEFPDFRELDKKLRLFGLKIL